MSEGPALGALLVSVEALHARPTTPALEALLLEVLDRCRTTWPTLTLAPEVFVPYLGQRLSGRKIPNMPTSRFGSSSSS